MLDGETLKQVIACVSRMNRNGYQKGWNRRTLLGALAALVLWPSSLSALTPEDWNSCARPDGLSTEVSVRACSAIIEAGKKTLEQLAAAYNNRGLARRLNGELEQAIDDYSEAIRLKPDYYIAINNRGVALMSKGEFDAAVNDFSRTIELKPDHLAAYYNRAMAFGRKSAFERAIADYDFVLKADPRNIQLLRERGALKAKSGDQAGADADFRRAASMDAVGDYPARGLVR